MSILSKSSNYNIKYAAQILRVENIQPLPYTQKMVLATLNGNKIPVSSDIKKDDVVIYFPVGTYINKKYLMENNLFADVELNVNKYTYWHLKNQLKHLKSYYNPTKEMTQTIKYISSKLPTMRGWFDASGCVKTYNIDGVITEGFVASVQTLNRNIFWATYLPLINWNDFIGESFDTYNGIMLCHKNINNLITNHFGNNLIPDPLYLHLNMLDPKDFIAITVDVEGLDCALATIKTPNKLTIWDRIKLKLGRNVPLFSYQTSCISEHNITTQSSNDIYGEVFDKFGPYIGPDMVVYGKIVGYNDGTYDCLKQYGDIAYDYKCYPGKWCFIPYKVMQYKDDKLYEYSLMKTINWTNHLISKLPLHLKMMMSPMTILYKGLALDLYPDLKRILNDVSKFDQYLNEQSQAECLYKNSSGFLQYLNSYHEYCSYHWRTEWFNNLKHDTHIIQLNAYEKLCCGPNVPRKGVNIYINVDENEHIFNVESKTYQLIKN